METLGNYLREARETRGIDLRDAAQQTCISIYYLKALEEENFSKLPGEVFVRGFLKNYSKFLRLDESEVMKKYGEMKKPVPPKVSPVSGAVTSGEQPAGIAEQKTTPHRTSLEPFIWAAGIVIALLFFFFATVPARHSRQPQSSAILPSSGQTVTAPITTLNRPDKLYLEVIALDNTWLLIRIDTSPQKKALLKKGENLIWNADERFQLSYSSANALQLLLNGRELTVNESKNAVVRDLIITKSGIVNRKIQTEYKKPKVKQQPVAQQQQAQPSERLPAIQPRQDKSTEQQTRAQEPVPQVQSVPSSSQ